jgi:hypothetical protein
MEDTSIILKIEDDLTILINVRHLLTISEVLPNENNLYAQNKQ